MTDLMPSGKTQISTSMTTAGGLIPHDLDQLWRLATMMAKSGMMPKGIQTPEAVAVAVQMGLEVGLSPMSAVQNIAVINGRPSLWGDSVLALVRASGFLDSFDERIDGDGGQMVAVCIAKRSGQESFIERTFSVNDAKTAGLWDKPGPWSQYPKRMLQMRARSWCLRDGFGDVLKGLRVAEEVIDITPEPKPKVITPDVIECPVTYTAEIMPENPKQEHPAQVKDIERGASNGPLAREDFINKKEAGYATFVHQNKDRINDASIGIRIEAIDKWNKFYPDDKCYLDPVQDDNPVEVEDVPAQMEDSDEQTSGDGKITESQVDKLKELVRDKWDNEDAAVLAWADICKNGALTENQAQEVIDSFDVISQKYVDDME